MKYLFFKPLFFTVILLLSFFVGSSQKSSPPNILLIVADDMGYQMSGIGTPGVQTPAIDALIKNGTSFTKAYAAFPSCSPSRASFLSGTHPHVNGVTTNVVETLTKNSTPSIGEAPALNMQFAVKNNLTTLVEALKNGGYFTGLTGKFHVSSPQKFPMDYWGREVDAKVFFKQAKASNKPFFLDYNFHTPHRPYVKSPNDRGAINLASLAVPSFLPNNALMQQDWSDYLGAVEATDKSVAEVVALLKKEKLYDNTLIIFTGDHGPSTHRGKYDPYEFGSHVPLIFAGPMVLKNVQANTIISLMDLMPTLLDYTNLPIPETVNGKSHKNVLLNGDTTINQYIFTEVSFPRSGENNYQARAMSNGKYWYIRRNGKARLKGKPEDNYEASKWRNFSYQATLDGKEEFPKQYKLLQDSENATGEELFDLQNDPWCMNDLLKNNSYKKILDSLRKDMDEWIQRTNDVEMMATIKNNQKHD